MTIRKLPAVDDRVETGPVQFGDDWPGVFIRGDNAAYFAMALKEVRSKDLDWVTKGAIESMIALLEGSRVRTHFTPIFPEVDGTDPEDFLKLMSIERKSER